MHINGPIIPEEIASHNPHVTDNDLPPLNFKKGENILPVIAETQIKNNPVPSKSFFKAIYIGKNALDISKNIAINPTLMPDSFNAFVPPGLLSPTSLMSFFEKT